MLAALPGPAVAVAWLFGGRSGVVYWPRLWLAVAVALGAAGAYYAFLRASPAVRAAAWVVAFAAVALSPALVPLEAKALRFAAALVSVATLLKLWDLWTAPVLGVRLGLLPYLAYLPNWFWLALRRPPPDRPVRDDLRRLAVSVPLLAAGVAVSTAALLADWSHVPFALEHCVKGVVLFFTAVQIAQTTSAAIRLTGGPAYDGTNHPFAARTPADFWRRWNLPVWYFLREHVFLPAGGARRPVRATLAAFAVSGLFHEYVFGIAAGRVQRWQMLFFMLQGCATVASMRLRPRGKVVPLYVAGTLAFNLAASVIFFRSVAAIAPLYSPR
jgi:hypothetical protein